MITATRNWLRRNRNNFAIGFGVLGAGYLAGQYVLSKITEANERMSNDRMAKEKCWVNQRNSFLPALIFYSLRRRFQQNQEDCTITVLALLPTARENIVAALPVESITHELQQKKAERLGKSGTALNAPLSELSSGPPSVIDGDGKSLASFESESYVHASQTEISSLDRGDSVSHEPVKSKAQLWNDLKINCDNSTNHRWAARRRLTSSSDYEIVHASIYAFASDPFYADTAQPSGPTKLYIECRIIDLKSPTGAYNKS